MVPTQQFDGVQGTKGNVGVRIVVSTAFDADGIDFQSIDNHIEAMREVS
jgi:hypothetical protein